MKAGNTACDRSPFPAISPSDTSRLQQMTSRRTSPGVGGRMAPVQRRRNWDRPSIIPTGFHRNEAFLPLAAEQEARPKHERGVTEGPGNGNRGWGSLQRETGAESEGAVRGAEERQRRLMTYMKENPRRARMPMPMPRRRGLLSTGGDQIRWRRGKGEGGTRDGRGRGEKERK
ncbi:hypothetical protein AJ78_07684 [Emergomyces pasteurianus Ep9510]|uniref:Uncharacterized protein n=1 Tax=Emergomyces pasteurianus Ep9510 TaxID=1447872 RepID=A0A1J9P632_9EURO|nr:hypothetical protein AJ78_07684 [Emergomyces pasteurianus Ep9510]